jgi:hypothetical protein
VFVEFQFDRPAVRAYLLRRKEYLRSSTIRTRLENISGEHTFPENSRQVVTHLRWLLIFIVIREDMAQSSGVHGAETGHLRRLHQTPTYGRSEKSLTFEEAVIFECRPTTFDPMLRG